MTPLTRCSPFALVAATFGLFCACSGTETDNPVAGNDNPVIDGPSNVLVPPSGGTPSCPAALLQPNVPRGLAQTVLLPDPNSHVLATGGASGLDLLDMSDPGQPVTLSRDVVRGTIHQLLLSKSGMLWVAASEAVAAGSGLPDRSAIDPELHLVELDVSDPRAPLRVAQATLDGEFWQMEERGDSIWALSARLTASERKCGYVQSYCGHPTYEAVVLRGFQVDASELTPTAQAELPFDIRAFMRPDGVATSLFDGSLHVLAWDAQNNLRAPLTLAPDDADHRLGPVDIVGSQLSVVDTSADRTTLRVYDLDAGVDTPTRSSDLGPSTPYPSQLQAELASSLLDSGRLWLSTFEAGPAQLWDVIGDTPQRIQLPQAFDTLLPISGATLATDPSATLAVGWQRDASGTEVTSLLAISGGNVDVVAQLDAEQLGAGQTAAPPGVSGNGSGDAWQLVVRGKGLPLGIDPSAPPRPKIPAAFVGIPLSGASGSSAEPQIAEARLFVDGVPALQITKGTADASFAVSPGANGLIAIPHGVIVVADRATPECPQPDANCSGYTPGIAVYDLSDQPRLAAHLDFPALPAVAPDEAGYDRVSWSFLGKLGEDPLGQPIDASQLTLVADLSLTCQSEETCAALGIDAVPFAQTNASPAPCIDGTTCPPPPPAPTVAGSSHREYFYRLALDAAMRPSWQPLGVSTLGPYAQFSGPVAGGDIAGAVRLEALSSSGEELPGGQARFMFDRFGLSPSGDAVTYPPVNVLGYPVARFADAGSTQRWLSVEVAPPPDADASDGSWIWAGWSDAPSQSSVHLLTIDQQGAHDAQSLPFSGTFSGAGALQESDGTVAVVVLTVPENACGTSELTAFRLDASGVLSSSSTLELPADRWSIVTVDGARAVLQRDQLYALVEIEDGTLSVVSLRSSDRSVNGTQLLGTQLLGAGSATFQIAF